MSRVAQPKPPAGGFALIGFVKPLLYSTSSARVSPTDPRADLASR